MKKLILLLAFLIQSTSYAVTISNCTQSRVVNGTSEASAYDVYTDIVNETRDFYDQLGDQRAEAIDQMVSTIIKNSVTCQQAHDSLVVIDDNFMLLFKIHN